MKKILPLFQLFYFKNVFNATFLMFLFTLPINVSANSEETSVNTKLLGLSSSNWRMETSESEYFNNNNVISNNNNANNKPSEKNEGISEFVFTLTPPENSEAHVPDLLPAKSTYGVVVFKKNRRLTGINLNGVEIKKNNEQEKLKAKQTFMEIAKPAPYQTKQSLNINLSLNSSAASSGNATITSTNQKKLSSEKDLKKLIEKNRKLNLLRFTENKGQVRDQNENPRPDVLFYGQDGKMGFHIKNNGISYQLYKITKWKKADFGEKFKHENTDLPDEYSLYRVDLNWLNSNSKAQWHSLNAHEDVANFYNVPNSDGVTNVNSYSELMCQNLYDGINLKYYESEGGLKHDYIVSPGADYKLIQVEIKGAKPILNEDGHLFLETSQGKIQEFKPRAFQNGSEVAVKYVISGNVLSYAIENYDSKIELIIDPLTRLWGTYYGGTSTEYGRAVDTDASGNVLMAGYTLSSGLNIISTSGSHQVNVGGGWDAFVAKFNTAGVRQWATYYGGSSTDYGYGVCSDAANNVFMTGYTTSNNNIASVGAHKAVYNSADAFLVKFNSAGVRQWGTYYGGTSTEEGYAVDTDASGDVYMVGYTSGSITDVATPGSHDNISNGTDAFLVKFNTSGVRQWATYYGGASTDYGYWVCVDNQANVYITGYTFSSDAISTPGSHQATYIGTDAFLAKFNSAGVRQWGTYYGGTSTEYGQGVCVDAANNVFLAGYTSGSATNIASVGAHDAIANGADAFLAKFNSAGVRLWGTYYGGTSTDYGYGVTTNPTTGHSFLTGYTSSFADIATVGAHDVTLAGTDAFIAEFNPSGVRQWGSYYGGTSTEYGYSICSDNAGNIFLAGYTSSFADIATVGSHDNIQNSDDAFLVKWQNCIGPAAALNTTSINNLQRCVNQTAPLSASGSGTIRWFATETSTITLATGGNYTTPALTPAGVYTYYVTGDNACSQSFPRTAVTVTAITSPTITLNNQTICSGGSASLTPSGGITYTWSTSATTPSIVVSPLVNTVYTVQAGVTGCIGTQTAMVTVSVQPVAPAVTPASTTICGSGSVTLTASGSSGNYAWLTSPSGPIISIGSSLVTPTLSSSSTYYVQAYLGSILPAATYTFNFTGALQTWVVPSGVTQVTLTLNGAKGVDNPAAPTNTAGLGGRVTCVYPVTPGQTLNLYVGGSTGYNGGGIGSATYGGNGGGASDIRIGGTALANRVIVAGGGGGGGWNCSIQNWGGGGGGLTGVSGFQCNTPGTYATGGTQLAGGTGIGPGTLGQGGNGANTYGGGGGGGYYGGGGAAYGGGGGGSSFTNASALSVVHTQSVNAGNGTILITVPAVNLACNSTQTLSSITVGPATPTIAVSNQTICAAQSATLTASGATTYTWNTNATTSSIVVTPASTTVYTVTSGSGICAAQKTVAVNVIPVLSTPIVTPNNFTLCSNSNSILTAASNATVFAWSTTPNGPAFASTPTLAVSGLTANTTYYVAAVGATAAASGSLSFNHTGSSQVWTVPQGVTSVTVQAWGAEGGGSALSGNSSSGFGGKGGYAAGILTVTPGSTLQINVGGFGLSSVNGLALGGFNGGGSGYASSAGEPGNGGGGASDVRVGGTAFNNRVIVAGGGGGGGEDAGDPYGHGGGLTGVNYPGYDATQIAAGPGGGFGFGGTTGQGDGGGGGGGWYGGGTDFSNSIGADTQGGGGGSGYIVGVTAGTLIAGNASMPSFSVGTMIGNSGHGKLNILWSGNGNLCATPFATVNIVGQVGPTVTVSNSQTICSAQSATLTASGAPNYLWSTSSTASSIVVSPASTTIYTVTGGSAACADQKTVAVTVTVQPSSPAVTPSFAAVCGSVAPTFTASGSSGIYAWYNAINGPVVGTGSVFTTPTLTNTSTYYLAAAISSVSSAGQTYTFTNAAATGSVGPTQLQVNTAYAATNLNNSVTVNPQGIQTFTVPQTGTYRIRAAGASANNGPSANFGIKGRIIQQDITLNAGDVLKIAVGQMGTIGNGGSSGGGGGSFVSRIVMSSTVPVIVAGGGGGQYLPLTATVVNSNGSILPAGFNGIDNTGVGGAGGNGGTGASGGWGGGGGGFNTNGTAASACALTGGNSFLNNANGANTCNNAPGGFGGGGGTHGNTGGGGGGGGYSGGGGCGQSLSGTNAGGGGGSFFNASASNTLDVGFNTGHGFIVLQAIAIAAPATCQSALVPITINVGPATPTINVSSNQTICTNASATISASGASSYTWSTNANTSSIVVTPSVTTTYTVSAGTSPCAAQQTLNVGVVAQPAAPVITPATQTICGTGNTTLVASGPGSNYMWFNAINGPIIANTNSLVTQTLTNTSLFYASAFIGSVTPASSFTFNFTGASQTWVVPAGVTQITVNASGAKGVDNPAAPTNTAGLGGRVTCVYPVTPGQILNIYVGGSTGYNGGGIGSATYGGNGGGASDIRIGGTALANRVIVAGGGGGGGWNCSNQNWGGGGGGLTGVSGFQCNTPGTYATGGTQLAGGTGIGPGTLGQGGNGANTYGGGGGGGYYGGGGAAYGGGGGGSSYTGPAASSVVHTQSVSAGNGTVIITIGAVNLACNSALSTATINVGPPSPTISVSNQTICSAQSATLTASGATTYTWNTNATTSSIVVTPSVATTYTVVSGFGPCADQKTVAVNVIPVPSTPIVTPNNFTLCSNSNSILTAASNATVFAWSTTPNGPAFASTPTLAVSGLTANTTYYVAAAAATAAASGSLSFNHTGSSQVWTVPQGVTSITVQAWGAKGGNGLLQGGNGGAASGVLSVVPGTTIQINVGGQGSVTAGGFNGGGNGGIGSSSSGSGGGGASDIRINGTTLANRVLVAAGGGGVGGNATTYNAAAGIGGSGANCAAPFGVGGSAANGCAVGNIGTCAGGTAPNYGTGGGGGGLNSGGALAGSGGGSFGQAGSLGQGGGGGNNGPTYGGTGGGVNGGGGGGGGYYGGAGGMSGNGGCNGGGGGGSSYANNAILTNVTFTGGISAGQGSVILSWSGNGNLCATPFATVNIVGQVGPTVTVSNSQTICSAQSATLTASGAPNYLWSTSSTASSIVVSPASTTIYTVTGGSAACADQKTVGVNVLPTPSTPIVTPNNFTLCSNINTVLTAASNATAYAWYTVPNGSIIANTSTLAVANLTTNATYYVLAAAASAAASGSLAFNFTGSSQSWTVPAGVTVITTTLNGARGGTGSINGANGGRVICNYNVTPGQVLNIFVGGQGGPMGNNAAGGFNGGGTAGGATGPTYAGSGGGGASDIRVGGVALANRIIVAGGGGGANNINGNPGVGGGLTGGNVGSTGNGCITTYATGGSQLAGGNACVGSASCCFFTPSPIVATLGIGGNGSGPATSCNSGDGGGGGGGGYYGGGGGGSYSSGAGGSSYTGPGASGVVHTQGVNAGNGSVIISWIGSGNLCPSPLATVNISALPGPTVTAAASNTYLCTGTLTSVLSATGATSYTWFPLNVNTNTVAVTPSLSTIYTVQGQNPNGCIDTKTVFITACSFLPVQLLSFVALKNSNVVDLIWETQTELNCDKFHIEKTLDFNSWKFVCEVKGSGNSNTRKSYMCKDMNPVNGINYYRLKQIDFNGSLNYSPIRQVKFDAEGNELLEVIPNPNDGNFVVIFDVEMNSETKIELTDAFGRIISESMSFKENFTGSKQIEMNISSLAAGVYFVNKITPNGIKKSKKVIKAY